MSALWLLLVASSLSVYNNRSKWTYAVLHWLNPNIITIVCLNPGICWHYPIDRLIDWSIDSTATYSWWCLDQSINEYPNRERQMFSIYRQKSIAIHCMQVICPIVDRSSSSGGTVHSRQNGCRPLWTVSSLLCHVFSPNTQMLSSQTSLQLIPWYTLSRRPLKQLTELAETTSSGRAFQAFTTRNAKKFALDWLWCDLFHV